MFLFPVAPWQSRSTCHMEWLVSLLPLHFNVETKRPKFKTKIHLLLTSDPDYSKPHPVNCDGSYTYLEILKMASLRTLKQTAHGINNQTSSAVKGNHSVSATVWDSFSPTQNVFDNLSISALLYFFGKCTYSLHITNLSLLTTFNKSHHRHLPLTGKMTNSPQKGASE